MKPILLALLCVMILTACGASNAIDYELSGTRWLLESMQGQALLAGTAITLKFKDGEMSGSSGCNFYGAKYNLTKDRFALSEIAKTEMGCTEPQGILEQEEQYVSTLTKSTRLRREGETLLMLDEAGKTLLQYRLLPTYETKPEDLVGKTWVLTSAPGLAQGEVNQFTLWFERDRLGGTTACRDYEVSYQTVEDNIQVTVMRMTTDVECSQEELRAEGTYTTLLERVEQYNLVGTQLELYTVQNDRLIYERAPGE